MQRHPSRHREPDTNKDRGNWFYRRSAYPLRDAPPLALEQFWDNIDRYAHIHGVEWQQMGPFNYAGRVTSLSLDPNNAANMFAGSAAGGVWKSRDGGDNWSPAWPKLLNQHIGALATHPKYSGELYCATGEGNLSADTYPGSGVYQTGDGGMTWRRAVRRAGEKDPVGGITTAFPRRVGCIAFGRAAKNDYRIALGAVSINETLPSALYIDEGEHGLQPCTFWGERNYNCYAVVFHPRKPRTMYVAIEPRGTLNGIWRSEDFGKSWIHLRHGLPPPETCGRISLVISPSDPEILYALIASRRHGAQGVYRTRDGGASWHETGAAHFSGEKQVSYNNTLAVHPLDPDFVLAGATNLHLTRNGGRSWRRVSTDQRGDAPGTKLPAHFVHPDHHSTVVTAEGVLYSGNDGGVARSEDLGKTWQNRSSGMVTAMFYTAGVAQTNSRIFGGGTQDNGTLIAGVPSVKGKPEPADGHFTRVLPGDGGWMEIHPEDAEHVFGSTSDLIISRHRRGEPWASGDRLANWTNISPPDDIFEPGEKQTRNIVVMEIAGRDLYCGTGRLWRSSDAGRSWQPVSEFFDDSAISAIEVSPANQNLLFVGNSNGGIFRSRDHGATWSDNLAGPSVPKRVITGIAFHPGQPDTVAITVAATGTPGAKLRRASSSIDCGESSPYSHVLVSNDLGNTWRPLDKGDHPDVVINALAFETHPPFRLFVGGDAGVWVREDVNPESATVFTSVGGNMPNVVVSDLKFHHKDKFLFAATYGRGIWRLKVDGRLPAAAQFESKLHRDSPFAEGLIPSESTPAPALLSPPEGAVIAHPRRTTLRWSPVTGALGYAIEVVSESGITQALSSIRPVVTFNGSAAGKVAWRVWAILPGSRRSPGSAARSLRYSS